MNIALLPKVRSKAIMRAAPLIATCTARICTFVGESCWPADTCVMCHMTGHGKGMGTKTSDLGAICACGRCHDIIDGRDKKILDYIRERYPAAYESQLRKAVAETQAHLIRHGLIVVPDGEIV